MPRRIVSGNLVRNGDMGIVPAYVADTNASNKWIDGSAAGSSAVMSAYRWAILSGTAVGTFSAAFDTAEKFMGLNSLKLTTGAVSSALECAQMIAINLGNCQRCGIAVDPSTSYTIDFAMKVDITSGDCNDGAFLRLAERNATGGSVTTTDSTKVKVDAAWQLYRMVLTTNASTRFLLLRPALIGNSGTGTLIGSAWFTRFIVRKSALATRSLAG